MRKFRLATLSAVAALALAGCSKDDDAPAKPSRVTLLFTTDEHSHLFAVGPESADWPIPSAAGDASLVGGVARRATVLDAERAAAAQRGGDSVVVSSGDWSQGTLASVAFTVANPDLGLMGALGYDVVALGNHELDLGPAALAQAIGVSVAAGQAPPLVLTNVVFDAGDPGDDALAAVYGERGSGKPVTRSRLHVTPRGIRIGFVSSMGYDAAVAAFVAGLVLFADAPPLATTRAAFLDAAAAMIQAEVDALRAGGVDAVVLLGHGGVKEAGGGDDELLVERLSGIDLVLAGHTHLERAPLAATDADGREVPVVAAPAYGRKVGRVELMLHANGRPTLIEDQTGFLPVDGTVVPTASPTVRYALAYLVVQLEAQFLPGTLSLVEGAPVADDPAVAGDLYFASLCTTPFDVLGVKTGETNALNLDTDAMLAVAAGLGAPADVALQASGAMRADFLAGDVSMADVFRMAPLGGDPTTGTPGYPLVRIWISTAELRAALELTLGMAALGGSNTDFFVSPSGLRVSFDPTRSVFDRASPAGPGWITELALVAGDGTETLLYDAGVDLGGGLPPGWTSDPTALRAIVTTYQVAGFAGAFGVVLRDGSGAELASLEDAILHWPATGSPTVKDHQALGSYLHGACASNGGELPALYDEATGGPIPRRVVCEGAAAVGGVCF